MSFDKLNSQFSLQDIDTAQLTKALSEHQNTIIKLALIIGTLVGAVLMFNDHSNNDRDLHLRLSKVKDKLNAIKAHDKATKDFEDFKSSIPKEINVFRLIPLISDYAKSYKNTVVSYTPDQSRNLGLYDALSVRFNMASDNFKNMMLFIRSIEKSSYPLRVESWSGQEKADGTITFEIQISAVHIHP